MSHFTEYALGTDPLAPSPEAQPEVSLERARDENTTLVARFRIDPQAIDSVVQVEASSDLAVGSWVPLRDGESGVEMVTEENQLVVRVPVGQPHQFLRLLVIPK